MSSTFETTTNDDVRDDEKIAHGENVIESSGFFHSESKNNWK